MRAVRWPLLAYVPAAAAVTGRRRGLGLPRGLSAAIAGSVPLSVATAMPRSKVRHALVWAAHMWAYKVAFEVPYDRPDALARRLRVDYAIACDSVLGLGTPPSQRLQRSVRRPPTLVLLDKVLFVVYAAWELEPHAAMAWLLLRHGDRFPRAAARLALTFDLTLAGYLAVPTAPPWWASEKRGRMNGEVHRVVVEVLRWLKGESRPSDHEQGANPWASMPSDHLASAAMTAIVLGEVSPAAGAAAAAYAAALAFALVYLGEHYVVDLLAGLALAEAVRRLEPALRPIGRLADEAWTRIEPD